MTLSACLSPYHGDKGSLTINFGPGSGGAGRSIAYEPGGVGPGGDIGELEFRLHLSGPGGNLTETVQGADTVRLSLAPGNWTVEADARYQGVLYAVSDPLTVTIGAGANNSVTLIMRPATKADSGEDFVAGEAVNYMYFSADDTPTALETYLAGIIGTAGNYAVIVEGTQHTIPSGTFNIPSGVKLSLRGSGTINLAGDSRFSTASGGSGNKLILRGPKLVGQSIAPLVIVFGGDFVMHAGEIRGNSTSLAAGGVSVSGGTFTMNGGTISGNNGTSVNGGGVYVNSGAFIMSGGTISGNSGSGVGVVSGGTFTMSGGTISGNTATGDGGGVYVSGGIFTMSDSAVISGNTASSSGSGVYVDGTMEMQGGAYIAPNNDVHLASGKYITVTGNLTTSETYAAKITLPTPVANTTPVLANNTFTAANISKFTFSDSCLGIINTDGTWSDYILLSSAADMQKIGNSSYPSYTLDKKYRLENNVTLTDWTPLGYSTVFTGSFDGGGKTITINSISATGLSSSKIGLFGIVQEATIKNLTVNYTSTVITTGTSESYIGGIIGESKGSSTFENLVCGGITVNAASVASGGVHVGGIIGNSSVSALTADSIKNCRVTGLVKATAGNAYLVIGGIAGYVVRMTTTSATIIEQCSMTGNVEGESSNAYIIAGGIAGQMRDYVTIKNCYNKGTVTATGSGSSASYAGGIAGLLEGTSVSVEKCYASGNVTLTSSVTSSASAAPKAGGIVGYNGTVSNCIALMDLIHVSYTGGVGTASASRVYGDGATGTNNYASIDMGIQFDSGAIQYPPPIDCTTISEEGANIDMNIPTDYTATFFSGTLNWDTTTIWNTSGLPPTLQ